MVYNIIEYVCAYGLRPDLRIRKDIMIKRRSVYDKSTEIF